MHDTLKVAAQPLKAHGEALANDGMKAIGLTGHTIGSTATAEQVIRARDRAVSSIVERATVAGGTDGDTTRTVELNTGSGKTARVTLRTKGRKDGISPAEHEHARLLNLDYASTGRAELRQIEQLTADLDTIVRYNVDGDGNPVPVRKLEGKARELAEHRLVNARRSLTLAQMDAAAAKVVQREHATAKANALAADMAEAQAQAVAEARQERIDTLKRGAAQKVARSGLFT